MKAVFNVKDCRAAVVLSGVLASLLLCSSASAGGLHIAASVGYMSAEPNGVDNDHGNFVGTATVGVEVLGLVLATIYAEFERTEMLDEGKWEDKKYDYSSDAAYLAVRTLGPVYAIGRVGYVKATFDPEIRTRVGKRDEAISVGVGYSVGLRNELLYTHIEHEGGGNSDMLSFLIGF